MRTQEKLHELLSYYMSTRQVGHTQLMLNGFKNSDNGIVVCADTQNAQSLKFKRDEYVTLNSLNRLRGNRRPIIFDNNAMYSLLTEISSELTRLRDIERKYNRIKQIINE